MRIDVIEVLHDHGSIVTFGGVSTMTDLAVAVHVDHRPAQAIADALARGETPTVNAPAWAVRPRND